VTTVALAVALLAVAGGAFILGWVAGVYSLDKAAKQGRYTPTTKDTE